MTLWEENGRIVFCIFRSRNWQGTGRECPAFFVNAPFVPHTFVPVPVTEDIKTAGIDRDCETVLGLTVNLVGIPVPQIPGIWTVAVTQSHGTAGTGTRNRETVPSHALPFPVISCPTGFCTEAVHQIFVPVPTVP